MQFKRKPKQEKLSLPEIQAQTLATMGAELRELRQEQSVAIDTIARQTLIPARLLRAIEDGDLAKLPEPVYIQGFLRRFADYVGLDGSTYAREFPTGNELSPPRRSWRGSSLMQLRPFHLYLLYIVLVIISVQGLSESVNSDSRSPDSSIPPSQTADNLDELAPTPGSGDVSLPEITPSTVTANASSSDPGNNPSQQVQVGVTLTDESWIQVVADGETTFEGMLSQGTHTWSANRELTVIAGNAGGVMIAVNGDEAQPMGAPGSVEELTVVANSQTGAGSGNAPTSAN